MQPSQALCIGICNPVILDDSFCSVRSGDGGIIRLAGGVGKRDIGIGCGGVVQPAKASRQRARIHRDMGVYLSYQGFGDGADLHLRCGFFGYDWSRNGFTLGVNSLGLRRVLGHGALVADALTVRSVGPARQYQPDQQRQRGEDAPHYQPPRRNLSHVFQARYIMFLPPV